MVESLTPAQRSVLAVLASTRGSIRKRDLCRAAGISTSSLDSNLSRIGSRLDLSRPFYVSRDPRPGFVRLDSHVVQSDVHSFRSVADVLAAVDCNIEPDRCAELSLAADDLWRGELFQEVVVVASQTGVGQPGEAGSGLRDLLRSCREAGASSTFQGAAIAPERLADWARQLVDSHICWYSAVRAYQTVGDEDRARLLLDEWRPVAVGDEMVSSDLFRLARRSLEPTEIDEPPSHELADALAMGDIEGAIQLAERSITASGGDIDDLTSLGSMLILAGEWDRAEAVLTDALTQSRRQRATVAEAQILTQMARLTWDSSRLAHLADQLAEVLPRLAELPTALARQTAASVSACLAGGLFQDGTVDPLVSERYARRALEEVSFFDDDLEAAEAVARARKALLDIDPPTVQLERSRRMLALAGSSDYHRCAGLLGSVVDLLTLGRTREARHETEELRRISLRSASPLHGYHVAALDGMWALHDGDWARAEAATAHAAALGSSFGGETVRQVVLGQRLWTSVERDDSAAMVDLCATLEPTLDSATTPAWTLVLAWIEALLGEFDRSERRLRSVAQTSHGFADLLRGPMRIACLALATLAVHELHVNGHSNENIASDVLATLTTHTSTSVLIGWPTIFLGPKDRLIGLAAAAAGDQPLAKHRLRIGLASAVTEGSIHTRIHRTAIVEAGAIDRRPQVT